MSTTATPVLVCRRCKEIVKPRRVPFGKTGRYLEIIGCRCQETKTFLRFENVSLPEDRKRA